MKGYTHAGSGRSSAGDRICNGRQTGSSYIISTNLRQDEAWSLKGRQVSRFAYPFWKSRQTWRDMTGLRVCKSRYSSNQTVAGELQYWTSVSPPGVTLSVINAMSEFGMETCVGDDQEAITRIQVRKSRLLIHVSDVTACLKSLRSWTFPLAMNTSTVTNSRGL